MGKLLSLKINNEVKPLYDIEVKDNHNFIVNDGILIKNSEQYLDDQGHCDLASLFAEMFYHKKRGVNWLMLDNISKSMNRFLDNVIQKEIDDMRYATYEQLRSLINLRRTGAGFTNIVELLLLNNLEYGSKEGNAFVENFTKNFTHSLYKASIELGKEKGNFEAFDREKYLKSGFIKKISKEFLDLNFDTMRNVCVISIAPTGTLSLMHRTLVLSYGGEPSFGLYHWKRTRISGNYEYYFNVPNIIRRIFEQNGIKLNMKSDTIKDTWDGKHGREIAKTIEENKEKLGIKFKSSVELDPHEKLDLISKIQNWVDSSISTTFMLSNNSTVEDVYKFILDGYKKEVKSIAAFPDKKMYGIISYIPFKDLALKLKSENINIHPQNFSQEELDELHLSNDFIQFSQAPKRPEVLPTDIYSVTVQGDKFIVAVGLLNGAPYEIFAGHMNGLNFKFKEKKGIIRKIKKGTYQLEFDDVVIEDFNNYFKPVEMSLFRITSTALRHGTPIKFLVEQLSKSTESLTSLTAAASRVLKKYIKEGETVSGMTCPSCHSESLIYDNTGCVTCTNCEWSKC